MSVMNVAGRWIDLTVVASRTLLAFGVALAGAGVAAIAGSPDPLRAAASWWIVTATLIDAGCLAFLAAALRREGSRFRDLFGYRGPRDLLWVPVAALIVAPGLALSSALTSLAYPPAAPPEITVVDVPAWAAAYAVLVWPLIWTVTEDLVYLGFGLPRLERAAPRWVAIALVLALWSLQHVALPLLPDPGYLVHRAVTPLPIVTAMTVAYFAVGRRLLPLIVVHWAGDTFTAILAVTAAP